MAKGCKNQITLFDYKPPDKTTDKYGRLKNARLWQHYERCENCIRWVLLTLDKQPPDGWGVYGWCPCLLSKQEKNSFCGSFEDKNAM